MGSAPALLLSLAVAIPVFGRMVGGSDAARWATIAGAGIGLSSIANVLEDGLGIEAAFFAFIAAIIVIRLVRANAEREFRGLPGPAGRAFHSYRIASAGSTRDA